MATNSSVYEMKYLKYKMKYLQLKAQLGGKCRLDPNSAKPTCIPTAGSHSICKYTNNECEEIGRYNPDSDPDSDND